MRNTSRCLQCVLALCLVLSFAISANSQIPKTFTANFFVPCTQKSFVDAIDSGDHDEVYSLMHPELQKIVDPPILQAWMSALENRLGEVQMLEVGDEVTEKTEVGQRVTSDAQITFKKGAAKSRIQTLDGKLVSFQIQSKELKDWFAGPTDTTMYEDMGNEFIGYFLGEDNQAAFDMCHPALQQQLVEPALSQLINQVKSNTGDVLSATVKQAEMDLQPNAQKLLITYELDCEKSDCTCQVIIQFVGMKGHLIGFTFK